MNATVLSSLTREAPEIHGLRGWRWAVLFPLGLIMRAWGWSLRFDVSPKTLRALTYREKPVAFVLWHNRLFVTP